MPEKNSKIGALWLKDSKGQQYFSGEVNGEPIVVFLNGYKNERKHPDWIIYKSRPRGGASHDD